MDVQVPYEESELVALLKEKYPGAFDMLYNRYAPAIYTIVLQIVRNKDSANVLLQEVFILTWCTVDKYDPAKGSLFTWMLQTARKMSIDEIRSSKHQDTSRHESEIRHNTLPLTEPELDKLGLKKVMASLGEEHCSLMELYYYKGFSIEKIADTMSLTEDTVKTRIRAALSELRNRLCKK